LIEQARESVRRLHAAGVPILAGTDAPNPGTAHGVSLHGELVELVAAGLSPLEALKAATSVPADAFGLPLRGRIVAGHRADLLLVEGEPDVDIEATRAIVSIWKNGYAVDRSVAVVGGEAFTPGLISDFEQGIEAGLGSGWAATTDAMVGGASTARLLHAVPGASGSAGALRVEGELAGEGTQVWAGAYFSPGREPMQAVDASQARELVFRLRGDGREVAVLLFHGEGGPAPPSRVVVSGAREWAEYRLVLADVPGLDRSRLRGIGFAVGAPVGEFAFELDDVELR